MRLDSGYHFVSLVVVRSGVEKCSEAGTVRNR